ncbi:D-glycero-alpha-D-manno-heptose-1,7-bisphosphate 7-phosphatase [Flavihumibacter fluvii]|uniref:D-glycero-alpha-D-manno-heptose-1,7-bisphosphate 7-phosphatase n=1 Tax=Flavihumibacter fluvii TaxID=2838157 RepID=UPI001BDF0EE2|nr:HAD-IIIA family hydrolase [Flavihumibacter fluvii]ULQ53903.1 HAD-IIIA family hydrolase [Flavihumibacter fluvii]
MLNLKSVDKTWTLFLDRDGVINREKKDDYIYHPGEFEFYDGAMEAMQLFSIRFNKVIIVTNQRGVEKGLMSLENLHDVHDHMTDALAGVGATIDKIYYCTSVANDHPDRKPQPGMALQAKNDFPDIDFSKSIMVGNNLSDMEFGRNAGMFTVFVKTTSPDINLPHPSIDLAFTDLLNFSRALTQA